MRVNTNYLAEYPVVDEEGDVVDISKEERDWILLVPEQYRPEESEIVEFWNNIRLGKGGAESVWEADLRIFGRSVSDPPP